MDRSTPIKLVSESYAPDSYGVLQRTRTKREVYANVQSVSASEWFEGGRNGLNPELRFTMFAPDYQGEKVVEYNNVQYAIYRTYQARNDTIELYTQLKKGEQYAEPEPEPTPDPEPTPEPEPENGGDDDGADG